jgi:hypothetical protein
MNIKLWDLLAYTAWILVELWSVTLEMKYDFNVHAFFFMRNIFGVHNICHILK